MQRTRDDRERRMTKRLRPSPRRAIGVFVMVCAVCAASTTAQEQRPAERQTSDGQKERPRRDPTAEDVLRALQRNNPPNDILQPTGSTADKRTTSGRLLPEGASVIDRTGHVEARDGGWVFVGDGTTDAKPVSLLRNATLEVMIRTAAGAPGQVSFVVSGEMTVFHGTNYLLIRSAMRANAPLREPNPTSDNHAAEDQSAPGGERRSPPSAEAVLKALRAEHPAREPVTLRDDDATADHAMADPLGGLQRTPGLQRSSGSARLHTLRADGTILVRRAGRVAREGDRWVFAPDSDHADQADAAMELLPCRATEFMLSLRRKDQHGLVFVVTGEITLFDGENYLLPRIAIRQAASDNLRN